MGTLKQVTDYYGHEVISMRKRPKEALLREAFQYWRDKGFPYVMFRDDQLRPELDKLLPYDKSRLHQTLRKPSMVGLSLANSFHPQIWEARVRGKSALDIFKDDQAFCTALARAPQMWLNRKCWNAACIRMLVGLQNRSRVANFRPTVSRVIAASVSGPNARILDFCAGYGGRYLGIVTLDRFYFGIDASRKQVDGLKRMSARLGPHISSQAHFCCAKAEEFLQEVEAKSFDLVFTSPPYFRLEKYEDNIRQCWRTYSSYQDWKEQFLCRVVEESFRALRSGGALAINIANYGAYPIADDFERICQLRRKRFFKWEIHMSTNPHMKSKTGATTKTEPLFVVYK